MDKFLKRFGVTTVYHFTDRSNLPSIRNCGGLLSLRQLQLRGVEVSYASSEDSRGIDRHFGLDDYVRLAFLNQHPMEFRARQNGNLIDPVYLAISTSVLRTPGVKIADGIAYGRESRIYEPDEAMRELDFEVLFTRTNWKEDKIKRRLLAAKKYEILIPQHVPAKLIHGL